MIFGAVQSILMIIILISFGYFAAYKGWVSKGTPKFITRLIINITLPCTILHSFLTNFTAQDLESSGKYIWTAFAGVIAIYLVGLAVCRIAKIEKRRRGVFTALFSFSNSVFIGFPVALAIFGESAMVYAIFFFFANTTCFNSLGYLQIAGDGEYIRQQRLEGEAGLETGAKEGLYGDGLEPAAQAARRENALSILKRVMQPPVFAVIAAVVLVLLNAELPAFISSTLSYTGAITTPLSLIFVGTIMHRVGFKTLRFEKGLPLAMIGRFLVSPLLMYVLTLLIGTGGLAGQVFIVQMALPCMVTVVIYAEACGADSGYATRGMVLSTLMSLIILPILVILFGGN